MMDFPILHEHQHSYASFTLLGMTHATLKSEKNMLQISVVTSWWSKEISGTLSIHLIT